MSQTQAQLAAVVACYFMHRHNYQPATLISVGVGSAAEKHIWEWLLPNTHCVGIDPRGRRHGWKWEYHTAAAHDGTVDELRYCGKCRSTSCDKMEEHGRISVTKAITIDQVAAGKKPPFFLWLDCDGGEMAALRGATETLKHTKWMNVEVHDFDWDKSYGNDLHEFIGRLGFRTKFSTTHWSDRLYYRRR